MTTFKEFITALEQNSLFRDWKKNHPLAYPSHFFCLITAQFQAKSSWEVGYYDPANSKITVFVPIKKEDISIDFEIKPEDEVFKEEKTEVEELTLLAAKISFEQASELFAQNKEQYFPKENLHDGFITLQTINNQLLWNFTFISQSVKFCNLKLSAQTGEIISNQTIDLVHKA